MSARTNPSTRDPISTQDPAVVPARSTIGATEPVASPAIAGPAPRWWMPRSRGMLTGLTLVVLGVWAGIVPFVGPYFDYAFINRNGFSFPTYGRLWLDILPGALTIVAGLMLIGTRHRASAATAGLLASIAGGWLIIGQSVSTLWNGGVSQAGPALGGTAVLRMAEQLGYYYLLGAVILLLGAWIAGRMAERSERDALAAARRADARNAIVR